MRFVYACDVHGDEDKYHKLLSICKREKIEYIVLGGDIYPKNGDRAVIQIEFIKNGLKEFFDELKKGNIKCILIPGNDDLENYDDDLKNLCDKYENVYNIDRAKTDIEDVCFIGLPDVLDNPFRRKNRVLMEEGLELEPQRSEEIFIEKGTKIITVEEWAKYRQTSVAKMEDVLRELPKPDKAKKSIYVLHDPPYGIGLDCCAIGKCVGSKAIVQFVKENNIYMTLHGHIHESYKESGKWKEHIGNTICIQPGQTELGEEKMTYVIVDTDLNVQNRFEVKVKEE
ncbi:MAG: metallophosphoesterase [Clostridia bacterium]|nr:metallophosphoesterase [Clostridia bacterium]